MTEATRFTGEIDTSAIDKRSYRHITLKNNLQCLLIEDPETEKSSACCDMMVGSMSDPEEAQGLAHFLEHMLFMGTEKYPVENAYSAFLSDHGGESNAYTTEENTVYYFDVQSSHFEGALDMFASFFSCPLFTEGGTERELNAVDSENTKNLQNDSWRKFQLFKSLARKDHPFSAFGTGNLKTLSEDPKSKGLDTRKLMIEFYEKYYSANLMKLVVYGSQSLDLLEKWVIEKFSAVPNKNLTRPKFDFPFGKEEVGKYLEIVPIKDVKNLEIFFPIPPVKFSYLTKPTRYLSHLIGHESEGSILSALKKKLLANNLSCYNYESAADFACFAVSIELSDNGVENVNEVIECVFSYIGMLLREGSKEWIWEEQRETAEMNFRFLNKIDPIDYTDKLSNQMQLYEVQHIISGNELFFECDLNETKRFLEFFKPNNSIIFFSQKGFSGKTKLKEKWYGTDYNVKDLDLNLTSRWDNCVQGEVEEWKQLLFLPKKNPFIPTDFSLRSGLNSQDSGKESMSVPGLLKVEGFEENDEELIGENNDSADKESEEKQENEEAFEKEDDDNDDDEDDDDEEGDSPVLDSEVSIAPLPGTKMVTWFLADRHWCVPKLNVTLSFTSTQTWATPLQTALTEVLTLCLKESLNEFSYYADCAGLYYDIKLAPGGFELHFQGYGHKLPVLVEKALEELRKLGGPLSASDSDRLEFGCSLDTFKRIKERTLRSYKNQLFWQPYNHCIVGSLLCLEEGGRWSGVEKYDALLSASIGDLNSFAKNLIRRLRAEILIHGNATPEEATCLAAKCQDLLSFLPLPLTQQPIRRVVDLRQAKGVEYVYRQHCKRKNPNEINSAIENIYLLGWSSAALSVPGTKNNTNVNLNVKWENTIREAFTEVLSHMLSEPVFDVLRTKEQLGYIVFAGIKPLAQQYLSLQIIVQSSHKDPVYLDQRIENFLDGYLVTLKEMATEQFKENIDAVIEKLLEKPKNLDQETERHWSEIRNKVYNFQRKTQIVEILRRDPPVITLPSLLDFFTTHIHKSSESRVKFSSQFYGKNTHYHKELTLAEEPGQKKIRLIKDPAEFRRSLSLMPSLTPIFQVSN